MLCETHLCGCFLSNVDDLQIPHDPTKLSKES